MMYIVFFFKQKTAYEMRISDWSSDVCSSDLTLSAGSSEVITTPSVVYLAMSPGDAGMTVIQKRGADRRAPFYLGFAIPLGGIAVFADLAGACAGLLRRFLDRKSTTSELQSLMRISYAVFCLKKKMIQHKKTK